MERTKEQLMDLMMKRMKEQIKNKKYKMTSQRQVVLRALWKVIPATSVPMTFLKS